MPISHSIFEHKIELKIEAVPKRPSFVYALQVVAVALLVN